MIRCLNGPKINAAASYPTKDLHAYLFGNSESAVGVELALIQLLVCHVGIRSFSKPRK